MWKKAFQIQGTWMRHPPWFYTGTSLVPFLCQWHAWGNQLQNAIVCWWHMPFLPSQNLDTISKKLNTEFNKLCDWFVDNKLSIHFGDDKTRSILFSGKNRSRDDKLKISRGSTEIAQHKEINYLGCLFDEKCTGEWMALKVIEKINGRLKFLWRNNKF